MMDTDLHAKTQSAQEKDEIPEEIADIVESLPPEKREEVQQFMMTSFRMMTKTSPEGEIAKKINSDHITSLLNTQDKAMTYSYNDNRRKQYISLVVFILACAMLILLILLLKDNPETMVEVLKFIGVGVISLAGGYGWGYHKGSKKDDD